MKKSIHIISGLMVLVLGALAPVAVSSPPPEAAADNDIYNDSPAVDARLEMRHLWAQQVSIMHAYIVSATSDLPDTEWLMKSATRNADDIAAAVTAYYSSAYGAKLSALLREHVILFSDAVRMAREREKDEMGPVQDKLDRNGHEIVSFLADANPNWSAGELDDVIEAHINYENDQLMARIDHDWDSDNKAWIEAGKNAMKLADMLSQGLERQFPDRFVAAN